MQWVRIKYSCFYGWLKKRCALKFSKLKLIGVNLNIEFLNRSDLFQIPNVNYMGLGNCILYYYLSVKAEFVQACNKTIVFGSATPVIRELLERYCLFY